ncbi:hypothetical protein F5Y12DRAFT_793908 [Xylaria sp. FL1777]|nr:hypothetical protein F5Y12DRAFT_793908 [Xylaria sp. FL1777]
MASQGDLNLARELQAEFGRAKPSKTSRRRRRNAGGGNCMLQGPSESQYQYQQSSQFNGRNESISFYHSRSRRRNRARMNAIFRAPRPAWHGPLVTNDSPGKKFPDIVNFFNQSPYANGLGYKMAGSHATGADMFFHRPQPPLPPPTQPTFTQATTPLTPTIQQPDSQQSLLDNAFDFSNLADKSGSRTFEISWQPTTDQLSPKTFLNAISPTSTTPMQQNKVPHTGQIEEQDDIEMESFEYSSALASKSTATNTSKGLASSMWNPANRIVRADSVSSGQSFKTGSDMTGRSAIVTSGITKGPGLKASRWYQES